MSRMSPRSDAEIYEITPYKLKRASVSGVCTPLVLNIVVLFKQNLKGRVSLESERKGNKRAAEVWDVLADDFSRWLELQLKVTYAASTSNHTRNEWKGHCTVCIISWFAGATRHQWSRHQPQTVKCYWRMPEHVSNSTANHHICTKTGQGSYEFLVFQKHSVQWGKKLWLFIFVIKFQCR